MNKKIKVFSKGKAPWEMIWQGVVGTWKANVAQVARAALAEGVTSEQRLEWLPSVYSCRIWGTRQSTQL